MLCTSAPSPCSERASPDAVIKIIAARARRHIDAVRQVIWLAVGHYDKEDGRGAPAHVPAEETWQTSNIV